MSTSERQFATDVVRRLRDAGHDALFAGGCVRDQLLGREPHDFDVATSARPAAVQALFPRTIAVGVSFGVVEVLGPRAPSGPIKVQVATFREDGQYLDGRRPDSVVFATAAADARRRDFTINGMFFDPLAGEVIDYVGGRADLAAGVLRAVGDPAARFGEDKLRLMRAARFAARFGLALDPATRAALKAMASQVVTVSAERIADELRKLLLDPERVRGWELLAASGLATAVFPEWGRVLLTPAGSLARKLLTNLDEPSFPLALAALLVPLEPQVGPRRHLAGKWAGRLKLSNAERDRLTWLAGTFPLLHDAAGLPLHELKPLLAHPGIDELLALHAAERVARDLPAPGVTHCRQRLAEWPRALLDPPPLLTGDDLRAMGLLPGPRFKHLLDAVRRAQLDGTIGTPAEATALVQAEA